MSNNNFMIENSSDKNPSETKLLMAEALKKLIKDRPFAKITVQDIVNECNINRNTFYYHFESNIDLLYFTYEREVSKVGEAYKKANATIPQAMDFVLEYIDKNIPLCRCAYESLGEQQLRSILEKDLFYLANATIEYYGNQNSITFSEDFRTFVSFSYGDLLNTQIIWYIKHTGNLDKEKFKEYFQTFFTASLKSILEEAVKKGF